MIGNRDVFLDRTNLGSLTFQLNHCGMQQCEPGYKYGFSMKPYHLLHFVLEGDGYLEQNKKIIHIQAGQAFYIPSGTPAQYHASSVNPWKYGWIGFYANAQNPFLRYLFKDSGIIDLSIPLPKIEKYLLSIISVTDQRLSQIEDYQESKFAGEQFVPIHSLSESLSANSRMLDFFSALIRAQNIEDLMPESETCPALFVKSYIDENYQYPIKIHDIADLLHIHPNYLTAVFKKAYGQTPKKYLCAIRMSQAAILLSLTNHPVSLISESVGYTNPLQFSSKFKSYYGMSPREYRKKQSAKKGSQRI